MGPHTHKAPSPCNAPSGGLYLGSGQLQGHPRPQVAASHAPSSSSSTPSTLPQLRHQRHVLQQQQRVQAETWWQTDWIEVSRYCTVPESHRVNSCTLQNYFTFYTAFITLLFFYVFWFTFLLKQYSKVLLMDYIYKTSWFHMLPLNIVDCTKLN